MITLTSADILALLKKNGLEPGNVEYEVVERLREKNLKVATAESCTGGLISERITRVSGASEVFDCGVCSYANEIKEKTKCPDVFRRVIFLCAWCILFFIVIPASIYLVSYIPYLAYSTRIHSLSDYLAAVWRCQESWQIVPARTRKSARSLS